MNGAMFHGKVGQFRIVPYAARKKLNLSKKIEDLIDMNTEDLEELARRKDKPDIYLGKDMQFHKIRLTPNWQELDPDELSEEYMSDEEPEDESLEPEPVFDAENPRRSKRART
jgi:hypothetical protein